MTTYSEEQISAIKQEAKESLLENLSGIMTRKDTSTSHASRKPPIFKYGEDFNTYLESWSNFARILNIPEADRGRLLFTYLDTESNEKLSAIKLTSEQKNNWTELKQRLRLILEPDSRQQARAKLFAMKQLPSETCEQFGRKLQRMASKAYDEAESAAREANIRDIFVYGILNNSIAIHLMNSKTIDFATLYRDAIDLEKNLEARKQASGGHEIEILKAEAPKINSSSRVDGSNKVSGNCFNCGKYGHWAVNCIAPRKTKKVCHYCNKAGHIKQNCFKFQNERRNKSFNNTQRGDRAGSSYAQRNFNDNRTYYKPAENRNLGNFQAPHTRK